MTSEKFNDIFSKIKNYGIIPTIRMKEPNKAVPLAKALASGGLGLAEITLDMDFALESIKEISETIPDMLLIAGNAHMEEQAVAAVGAGAKLVVSPGFDEKLISYCVKNKIALIPECSADDIGKALDMGIDVVKFSLAGAISADGGSIEMINTLSGKYPKAKFILSSGINEDNIVDYLSQKSVLACFGSYMISEEDLCGDITKIKNSTLRAVRKMLGFDLAHVVMNCENAEQAEQSASKIESIFGFEKTDAGTSISTEGIIHFMKSKSYGKNGQIAISSNFIDKAVFHLKESGKNFIEESARFNNEGELTSIYLDSLIGGFAIKLVPKK